MRLGLCGPLPAVPQRSIGHYGLLSWKTTVLDDCFRDPNWKIGNSIMIGETDTAFIEPHRVPSEPPLPPPDADEPIIGRKSDGLLGQCSHDVPRDVHQACELLAAEGALPVSTKAQRRLCTESIGKVALGVPLPWQLQEITVTFIRIYQHPVGWSGSMRGPTHGALHSAVDDQKHQK